MTPSNEILTVDFDEAQRFLDLVAPDGDITFQTFDDSSQKRRCLTTVAHGTFAQHKCALEELNSNGAGVFFTVNRTNMRGRKASDVLESRALFIDLDGSPLEAALNANVKPSIVVESSQNRWHAYWLIEPGFPLDKFRTSQKCLALAFKSDPAVCDLPRVMRLPGFFHQKRSPFRTRVLSWGA